MLQAQNMELIEKLREDVKTSTGEHRLESLNALAWEYRSAFPDSAIKYAEQALSLSAQLKLSKGSASTLNYLGLAHYYKGNFIRAYENYENALTQATSTSDSVQIGYAFNNIGPTFLGARYGHSILSIFCKSGVDIQINQ
ncbi:MAG: hypothetical protein WDO15_24695 [Bacteroidota bacterium]